jgi:hypothetical protein
MVKINIREIFNRHEFDERVSEEIRRRANRTARGFLVVLELLIVLILVTFWSWIAVNNLLVEWLLVYTFTGSAIASIIVTVLLYSNRAWRILELDRADWRLRDNLVHMRGRFFIITATFIGLGAILIPIWSVSLYYGMVYPISPGSITINSVYSLNTTNVFQGRSNNTTVSAIYLVTATLNINLPTIATIVVKNVTLYNPLLPVKCAFYSSNYDINKLPAVIKIYSVSSITNFATSINMNFICNAPPTNAFVVTNYGNFTLTLSSG